MARNRTPVAKAAVSGAAIKHPGRFKDRKAPKANPLGAPYPSMTAGQKKVWKEIAADMPWLNRGHRILVRLACVHAARMDEEEGRVLGVSATQALSSILSKLGATPVDETKVTHGDPGEEDPTDRFFGRPH